MRPRLEQTDDWEQLQLLTGSLEKLTYELIRPVVLSGHSPAERAQQTGAPARTLYRQVARFATDGMASLFAPPPRERPSFLPDAIRDGILCLKVEHLPLNTYEITTICWALSATAVVRCPRRVSCLVCLHDRLATSPPDFETVCRFPARGVNRGEANGRSRRTSRRASR